MFESPESTAPLHPSTTDAALSGAGLHRRQVVRGGLALAAAGGVVMAAGHTSAVGSTSLPAWSDPSTWGTRGVPRAGDVVVLDFPVRLDRDVSVAGLHVECGGHLVLDPNKSVTIRSTGNVEVCGVLEMRPAHAGVQHLLRFEGINESQFRGGGMHVLPSDVGLWVHGEGQLDLHGTPRTAWLRAAGSLAAGTRTIRLSSEPIGWRVGDELVLTPTGSPADTRAHERFDAARIQSISGAVVTLSSTLRFAHPQVAVGDGHVVGAEVLNLTRNVGIEGTPSGRTHTMAMMVTRPQQVRYAAFRHFGPRQAAGQVTEGVLGRYGFHVHMAGNGSRGTVLEGVVMRDGGNHAFVPHESHGITLRSCVSYDTLETPFWWDLPVDTRAVAPETHDAVWEACVAARVASDPPFRGFRLSGFQLAAGRGNRISGCVATGVGGTKDASGFTWPEGSSGVWEFNGCVSHNNARHGVFTWQNSQQLHVVSGVVAYHNGGYGISHGAYRNGYVYRDSILYGNAGGGVLLHAVSRDDKQLQLINLLVDGAGFGTAAIELTKHNIDTANPTVIRACRLRGYRKHGIWVTGPDKGTSSVVDLVDVIGCTFSGNMFWMEDAARKDSQVRVASADTMPMLLRHWKSPQGKPRAEWHVRAEALSSFRKRRVAPRRLSITLPRQAPVQRTTG